MAEGISGGAILDALRDRIVEIRSRFGVRRLGLFGSLARGEEVPGSDADILVEFDRPSFDNYMDLKFYLEDLLAMKVDLVMADTLKTRLRPVVLQEVRYA